MTPYTPRVKKVLTLAADESRKMADNFIGTEHVLLGIFKENDSASSRFLRFKDVHISEFREFIPKDRAERAEWYAKSTMDKVAELNREYDVKMSKLLEKV